MSRVGIVAEGGGTKAAYSAGVLKCLLEHDIVLPYCTVAVIGGGMVGCETAEYLASRGCKVSVIEMMDKIAAQESDTVLPLMEADFEKYNVQKFVNTRVSEIKDNVIYAVNTKEETNIEIAADTIVNALGSKKNVFDDSQLTVPFTYVGDCSGERTADIASAIRTGYKAANEI